MCHFKGRFLGLPVRQCITFTSQRRSTKEEIRKHLASRTDIRAFGNFNFPKLISEYIHTLIMITNGSVDRFPYSFRRKIKKRIMRFRNLSFFKDSLFIHQFIVIERYSSMILQGIRTLR